MIYYYMDNSGIIRIYAPLCCDLNLPKHRVLTGLCRPRNADGDGDS